MRRNVLLPILVFLSGALVSCDGIQFGQSTAARGGYDYKVSENETLYHIAEKAYGDGREWPRIHEANQWVDPERLQVGEKIYIPMLDRPEISAAHAAPAPRSHTTRRKPKPPTFKTTDPGNAPPAAEAKPDRSWSLPMLSEHKVFGVSVHKFGFFTLTYVIFHALFQGFFVWITANITFVRDASIRKSMKATFLTETLTLCTMVLLGVVGLVMLYVGMGESGTFNGSELMATFEGYVSHPAGIALTLCVIVGLYTILSLRFIPQIFDIQMGRAFTIVFFSILIPHLSGIYILGQRMGWFSGGGGA